MQHTMLVFGLTGDLMKKKGIPAIFALWKKQQLPKDFRMAGLSRKVWSADTIAAHITESIHEEAPKEFVNIFSIFTGQGESVADLIHFKKEFDLGSGELYTYLCVSPELYLQILTNLATIGLLQNTRLLIEKPFGFDLKSAQELQKFLLQHIQEEQIYRIDHFLAKEAMGELSSFAGGEVTSIEVYLNEAFGVEKRGALYDPVGALRDVGQNHLLEAAAAVLGDRVQALLALHTLSPEEVKTHTKRGQYEGYAAIEGVRLGSKTETSFSIESWFEMGGRTIPLRIESGKCLPSRREVVVTLAGGEKVIPFESGTNEYEILFADAFAGGRSRFVSMREVEALWKFTDPIEESWKKGEPPIASYPPHTDNKH